MARPTISQVVQRGKLSIGYAANNNSKGTYFGKRLSSPKSPVTIAMVTDALEWSNDGGAQTDAEVREIADYLIWLTGIYGQQAQYRLGQTDGGGSLTPGGGGVLIPNVLDFIVDASTTPVLAGETTITIPQFVGYNVEFDRGGQPQYTTNPNDGSSYYYWNKNTGEFTISPAANLGEPFRIVPVGGFGTNSSGLTTQRQPVFAIVGVSVDTPTAGTDTWTNSNFVNAYVTLFLNGTVVAPSDTGTGTPYITKALTSDTITISNYTWQANDQLLVMIAVP